MGWGSLTVNLGVEHKIKGQIFMAHPGYLGLEEKNIKVKRDAVTGSPQYEHSRGVRVAGYQKKLNEGIRADLAVCLLF
ncbi:hypothetical protein Csa_003621 [Cucumis sativus]|nr:hypothetical protein Csa_003621 [Cucumis sativus]